MAKKNEAWRKEYKEIWGRRPPPHSVKWMAEIMDMIGDAAKTLRAMSDKVDIEQTLESFADFCKEHKNTTFEEFFDGHWQDFEDHRTGAADEVDFRIVDRPSSEEVDDVEFEFAQYMAELEEEFEEEEFEEEFEEEEFEEGSDASFKAWLRRNNYDSGSLADTVKTPNSLDSSNKDSTVSEKDRKVTRTHYYHDSSGRLHMDQYHDDGYIRRKVATSETQWDVEAGYPGDDISKWSKYAEYRKQQYTSYGSYSYGSYGGYTTYSSTTYAEREKLKKMPYRPKPFDFPEFKWKRTIIVGDLHGCADELLDLLKDVNFKPGEDRLISVGDIVDRGPGIHECFEILREYKGWATLGNHEEPFLKWRMFETDDKYKDFRGKENPIDLTKRADQAATLAALTEEDWEYMEQMQLFFKLREYKYNPLVVHAGLFPGRRNKPEKMDPFSIIRMINLDKDNKSLPFGASYGTPWWDLYEKSPGPHHVIYGHTTTKEVRSLAHSTGLDTGAVYGGELSCLVLPDWQYHSVPARSHHYTSSAAEISGGQSFVIGSVKGGVSNTTTITTSKTGTSLVKTTPPPVVVHGSPQTDTNLPSGKVWTVDDLLSGEDLKSGNGYSALLSGKAEDEKTRVANITSANGYVGQYKNGSYYVAPDGTVDYKKN